MLVYGGRRASRDNEGNPTMSDHLQVVTTTEKAEHAEAIARLLVEKRLAACVQIGGPIIDFTVAVANDESFELGSLRGKPFLLKFFRGHW